jgi:hypothetical protein
MPIIMRYTYLVRVTLKTKLFKIEHINITNEKNGMGGACSAYGGGKRRVQGFGGKT